jgi:hypothetical protein
MSHIKIQSYLIVGKTGSGKTFSSKQILENEFKSIPMDNRFLISPTAKEDMDTTLLPYFEQENIYNEYDDDFVGEVLLELIKTERKEIYDNYHYTFNDKGKRIRIKRKAGDKPDYPEYLVFVDDCIEHLKKTKGISSLITKSRHYGINLIITSQYLKSVHSIIRTNVKNIFVFSNNSNEVRKLFEEHGSIFDNFKDFKNYFNMLTEEPYTYFKINYNYPVSRALNDNDVTPKEFLGGQAPTDGTDD